MSVASVVIVGAGAAGTAAATQLRSLGFAGDLTLVNAEGQAPYNRTTVNKTLLHPDSTLDSVRTALPNDPRATLLAGRAERLDTERRAVVLQDGNHLSYDAVLIATGARPRLLLRGEQNVGAASSAAASRPCAPTTTPSASGGSSPRSAASPAAPPGSASSARACSALRPLTP